MNTVELEPAAAVAHLGAGVEPLRELERRSLGESLGRVLGADLIAAVDVPSFDNAAMDGYALRAVDQAPGAALHVVGRALAGHPFGGTLGPGEAVRITTGAALPAGADAVAMQEDVQLEHDRISISSGITSGRNVRPRGEQLRAGAVVLERGRRLRSYDLGLAAAAGASELALVRRLRVGVLSTGDELQDPADAPAASAGQYDGNRPTLCAALGRTGYEAVDLGIVRDDDEALLEALRAAARARLDVVLSTGGVAQGDADIVRRFTALEYVPLALRPGRGLACGRIELEGHVLWCIGMPGNAVAAYVIFQLVVAPLLARRAGARAESPVCLELPLAGAATTGAGRIDWRRGCFVARNGRAAVELLAQQGSSMLRTLCRADALVGIGPRPEIPDGQPVPVIPLAALP